MKLSLNPDTLAFQMGIRPAVKLVDRSLHLLPNVVTSLNSFMGASDVGAWCDAKFSQVMEASPEVDALTFYMLNHAVGLIRQEKHVFEPLGPYLPIVDTYHSYLSVLSARMFYYMLLICTRESRHEKQSASAPLFKSLTAKYGYPCVQFQQSIRGAGSSGAAQRLRDDPPITTIGTYTKFLVDLFNKGDFSSGYGGPAWGKVAEVLRDFVCGVLSAEMMMDTAFTLCHNNGPIFNKGMLFKGYGSEIYKILDVQRSGQIPQLVGNAETSSLTPNLTKLWTQCHSVLGKSFGGHVDWFLVEELGALKTYKNQQTQQVAKYGYPSKFKAKLEAEKLKSEVAAKQKLDDLANYVYIMPNVKVKKVKVRP